MEIKATLQKPFEEKERMDFIVEYNHNQGYEIRETEEEIQAWGYTEDELELQENIRISKLTCTKRVFALMLQELGITYTMLKELIATNEQAQLEWDLSVQLERGNPLIDIFGEQLGVTREQIDILFKVANGEATVGDLQKTIKTIEPEENLNNEVI